MQLIATEISDRRRSVAMVAFKRQNETRALGSTPGVLYILSFFSIFILIKKIPFLADFIKNWVHFIKNSDVISLVIYQSQPKLH